MLKNRVLILDDRPERRKSLMSEKDIIELQNCENKSWLTLVTELPCLNEIEMVLSQYSMIAIHRSWLVEHSLVNIIEEYTKKTKKYFIVFSGGISQNLLLNNRMRLNINASIFYSTKLPKIIKKHVSCESKNPLLELLYGDSWRLSLLLEYRNLIWLGGVNYDQQREDEIRRLIFGDENTPEQLSEEWINSEINKEKYNYTL